MSTVRWPGFAPSEKSYSLDFDVQLEIARNGRVITHGLPGARWMCSVDFEAEVALSAAPKGRGK